MEQGGANILIKILHSLAWPELFPISASSGQLAQSNKEMVVESRVELLALLSHAAFIADGFRLCGIGAFSDNDSCILLLFGFEFSMILSLKVPDNLEQIFLPEPDKLLFTALPADKWKLSNNSLIAFRYKHAQSAMTFVLKIVPVSVDIVVTLASAIETRKVESVTWNLNEIFTSQDAYPVDLRKLSMPALFGLVTDIKSFFNLFHASLLDEILPKSSRQEAQSSQRAQPESGGGAFVPPPQPSRPQHLPPRNEPGIIPVNPFGIGERDLDPLGSIRPPIPGGGMFVGPDHPMFQPYDPRNRNPAFLPPGAVPPGARFDPISPLNPTAGLSIPPNRRNQRPRSGDPDFDELSPPGFDDMYM